MRSAAATARPEPLSVGTAEHESNDGTQNEQETEQHLRVLSIGLLSSLGQNMSLEYKTLKFPNDIDGLRQKDESVTRLAASGWRVVEESVETGHMRGSEACCLASICLPMGFLSGRTPGSIVVTLTREAVSSSSPDSESTSSAPSGAGRNLGARLAFVLGRLAAKLRRGGRLKGPKGTGRVS